MALFNDPSVTTAVLWPGGWLEAVGAVKGGLEQLGRLGAVGADNQDGWDGRVWASGRLGIQASLGVLHGAVVGKLGVPKQKLPGTMRSVTGDGVVVERLRF